jgi:hypothetical protein
VLLGQELRSRSLKVALALYPRASIVWSIELDRALGVDHENAAVRSRSMI